MVAVIRDPALAIWQAMKCLAEVHARTDAPHISNILAEAEIILFGLVLALVRPPKISGSIAPLAAERAISALSPVPH